MNVFIETTCDELPFGWIVCGYDQDDEDVYPVSKSRIGAGVGGSYVSAVQWWPDLLIPGSRIDWEKFNEALPSL